MRPTYPLRGLRARRSKQTESLTFPIFTFFLYSNGPRPYLHSFPTRRSSDLARASDAFGPHPGPHPTCRAVPRVRRARSEEHTSELQSRENLVCRPPLEKKKRGTN